jgi:hypothetical protein
MTTYNSPFSGDVVQPTDVSYASYNFATSLSIGLWWPINGVPDGLSIAARIMDLIPPAASCSIVMPPANQASVGQDALFNNEGAFSVTIFDYNSNTIATVPAGKSVYIYITNNATTSGVWGVIDFGTTTSATTASALAGYGLLAISNTLNQSHPSLALANGYTFLSQDRAKTAIWGGGSGSVTLNDAITIGDNWFILLKNNGTGTLTVNCSGINTLDLQPNKTFQPNESAVIVCNGSNYVTVGYGTSNTFLFTALTKAVTTGTYVLTTSEAQSIIQEFVGTQTGNVTVVYPPVVALYVISNQTVSGGYSFTVTTGIAGSAVATIPSGQQASLICDGVSFFNANTVQAGATAVTLANGTVSNPSLGFAVEPTTGIYRVGTGAFGVAVLGVNRLTVNTSGISVNGTGTFSGGVLGGTF